MIEVDPWMVSTFLLLAVAVVGGIYIVLRELQFRAVTDLLQKSGFTLLDISHSLGDVCRAVEGNSELSREHKHDITALVLDVEKRVNEQFKETRNWMTLLSKHGHSSPSVNIHGGANQNSFGDDASHKG